MNNTDLELQKDDEINALTKRLRKNIFIGMSILSVKDGLHVVVERKSHLYIEPMLRTDIEIRVRCGNHQRAAWYPVQSLTDREFEYFLIKDLVNSFIEPLLEERFKGGLTRDN